MIGEGCVIMAEATSTAAKRGTSNAPTFKASALLLSGSSPTMAKADTEFDVCNLSDKRVCVGDKLLVAKTMQGHFVTVNMETGRARFVVFTKSGESWEVTDYWDGEDPEQCGTPDMECLFPCDCLKDGDKVLAVYSPQDDKYWGMSSASALLGTPQEIEFIDGENGLNYSTGNCGDMDYQTKKAKAFICAEEGEEPEPTYKSAEWNGTITEVLAGAAIVTDSEGNPCWKFTRVFALVCNISHGEPDPIFICGEACCEEEIYYNRYQSPNEVPQGATYVGDYTYGYLTDAVAEQCFLAADVPSGWIKGPAEVLGVGFVRSAPSPECCTEPGGGS